MTALYNRGWTIPPSPRLGASDVKALGKRLSRGLLQAIVGFPVPLWAIPSLPLVSIVNF